MSAILQHTVPWLRARPLLSLVILLAPIVLLLHLRRARRQHKRRRTVLPSAERVLVIGASSGVGRALALQYASRGALVCAVARRKDKVEAVAAECGAKALGVVADFTNPEDMVNVRETLRKEWGGVDTVLVCAGVSSLQPVMNLTGAPRDSGEEPTLAGIQEATRIATLAQHGNITGPLVAALTFIPMLAKTSKSPSMLQISSVAALIPAPTRALYCSTKASALSLYQSLAIEHPEIAFSLVLPATIEGDFRASAVDKGPVREADPSKHGLKADYVAMRCIKAVDEGTRMVVLPAFYMIGHFLTFLWPSMIEKLARKKYNYHV